MTTSSENVTREQLQELLRAHRLIGSAPPQELAWLMDHGEFRRYAAGAIIAPKEQLAVDLLVVFSGRIVVYLEHGSGRRHPFESVAGTVTGVLPYSRLQQPFNDAIADEPTEVLAISRDLVPEMIRECPTVTTTLVHTMLDRARRATAMTWQDEKLQSLGRLAAGLAHELNNPASAATRGAKQLRAQLLELGDAAHAFGGSTPAGAADGTMSALIERCLTTAGSVPDSALDRAEREDRVLAWLETRGLDGAPTGTLASHGVTPELLDQVAATLPRESLGAAIRWLAAALSARTLLVDVERATGRVSDLVAAVKRFSSMDRSAMPQAIDVVAGIRDTVAVWAARSREQGTVVRLDAGGELPRVDADAGALNQVWSNLLENALDAVGTGGEVAISVGVEPGRLVVRVVDNGPGIGPDVQARMFDPFFTTKPIGKGIGLGLDIARRVVREHAGSIDVESRPGKTELRVSLPVHREPPV